LRPFAADAPDRNQRQAGIARLPEDAEEGRLVGDVEPLDGETLPPLGARARPEPIRPFVAELALYYDLILHASQPSSPAIPEIG
jgi:hypothetical protein